jgi:hypothetical protein
MSFVVTCPRFKNAAWQEKLLGQLLMPLFAQIRRGDDEDSPFPFCPSLGDDQACFDGFAEADFIGEDRAF